MKHLCAALMALCLTATTVTAKPPLREVSEIDDGLLYVALADVIRKNCPNISARMIKAVRYVTALENKARSLGYSKEEIKAYTGSDAEKNRMRAKANMFLQANGVEKTKPETFCALGLAEIEKASRIGSLLRAK